MGRFVALLRGINVGGNNLIRMPALAACFEAQGHAAVRTYIQSGNVVFHADQPDGDALEGDLEAALLATFKLPITVVVRSHAEMAATVADAPPGFGCPDHRCDVIFLKHPLSAEEALAELPPLAEGVDEVASGPGALYFSRVAAKASRSRMSKIVGKPVYRSMTIRNWRTTTRLLEMLDEAHG
jgi:uncharacterized protein (DUF1697 family)